MAALGRSRTMVLGGVAIALVVALGARHWGDMLPAASWPELQSEAQITARIESFKRLVAARDAIDAAYFEAVGGYAEAMATAITFMPKGGEARTFAEKLVRETIMAQGPVRNLVVTLGEASRKSDGVTEIPLSIAFVSGSQTALAVIGALGQPERGMLWDELSVGTDAKSQTVSVSGRVAALVLEAAE